jgi:hypothetical protein
MFERTIIENAVDLQQRSYKLLRWMADAVDRGFISTRAAHSFSTLPEAALDWLDRHYNDLPNAARPERDDARRFANLFSSYLESSFDLYEHPRQRLYSPEAHCFCPMCSWLVDMPRLQPKKLTRHDKERARKLSASALRQLAIELDLAITEPFVEQTVDEAAMREPLALVAYGHDLLRRLAGVVEGPATLALWRRFAWTPEGSPKHGYQLTAAAILDGEAAAVACLRASSASRTS